jgi:hypothetical protein
MRRPCRRYFQPRSREKRQQYWRPSGPVPLAGSLDPVRCLRGRAPRRRQCSSGSGTCGVRKYDLAAKAAGPDGGRVYAPHRRAADPSLPSKKTASTAAGASNTILKPRARDRRRTPGSSGRARLNEAKTSQTRRPYYARARTALGSLRLRRCALLFSPQARLPSSVPECRRARVL